MEVGKVPSSIDDQFGFGLEVDRDLTFDGEFRADGDNALSERN